MFCPGWQKRHGMFCLGRQNEMECFAWDGKSMRDVLTGVSKNGMGCFVPECFVLHSFFSCCYTGAFFPIEFLFNTFWWVFLFGAVGGKNKNRQNMRPRNTISNSDTH